MSENRGKMHFNQPVYLYEYLRVCPLEIGRLTPPAEGAMYIDKVRSTPAEEEFSDTLAIAITDAKQQGLAWKHLLHTLNAGSNISITRDPFTGIATISAEIEDPSTYISNATCSTGKILESSLTANGTCYLNKTVNLENDYWEVHVYRHDGQEVYPEIGVQTPGSTSSTHLYISFGSKDNFKDMSGMSSNHYLLVKVLTVNVGVGTIDVGSTPYAELQN